MKYDLTKYNKLIMYSILISAIRIFKKKMRLIKNEFFL